MFDVDTLYLDDEYTVNVKVEYAQNYYVSGILKITTKKITLEISSDRTISSMYNYKQNIEKIECTNYLNATFILLDLKLIYSHNAGLDDGVSSFFHKYIVTEILYNKYPILNNNKYNQLSFESKDIAKWIGNTNLQQEIIENYHTHSTSTMNTREIIIDINNMYLIIHYPITRYDNSPKQKAGIHFAPVVNLVMQKETTFKELKEHFNDLLNLFYLLIGYDLDISKVQLHADDNENISYYYTQDLDRDFDRLIFINLGHNLRYGNVEKLPLEIFQHYFSLTKYQKRLFFYHKKYKLFKSGEESFLGFFRILENTMFDNEVFSDELVKQLRIEENKENLSEHQINKCKNKKLKTQACTSYIKLLVFYNLLDNELKEELKITKQDIREIVKLRNDITHFNEYDLDIEKIKEYSVFLEFFSTYTLLRLLDYPKEQFHNTLGFYAKYHMISKRRDD